MARTIRKKTGRKPTKRRKSRRKRRVGPLQSGLRRVARSPWLWLGVVLLAAVSAWLVWPFWQLSGQLDAHALGRQPSRIYAQSMELWSGEYASRDAILEELRELGYRETEGEPTTGEFRPTSGAIVIGQRGFPTTDGAMAPHRLEIRLSGRTVRSLVIDGREVERALLEPAQRRRHDYLRRRLLCKRSSRPTYLSWPSHRDRSEKRKDRLQNT